MNRRTLGSALAGLFAMPKLAPAKVISNFSMFEEPPTAKYAGIYDKPRPIELVIRYTYPYTKKESLFAQKYKPNGLDESLFPTFRHYSHYKSEKGPNQMTQPCCANCVHLSKLDERTNGADYRCNLQNARENGIIVNGITRVGLIVGSGKVIEEDSGSALISDPTNVMCSKHTAKF